MFREGTQREINGDSYTVIFDFGEMETLCKDGFYSIFFPNASILVPCGKKKHMSRKVEITKDTIKFNGIVFCKEEGYASPTDSSKQLFVKLQLGKLVFNIDANNKLFGVTFK